LLQCGTASNSDSGKISGKLSGWADNPSVNQIADTKIGQAASVGRKVEVKELSKGSIKLGPGTLYSAIKRLLADELIAEEAEKLDRTLDDECRRYYSLTQLGRRVITLDAEQPI
jgi:hypothetical protein